ncbi:MAG: rRNA maturation RNase YbeY [Gammaproteobacteria bacterium]
MPRKDVPTTRDFRDWIGRAGAALGKTGRVSVRIVGEAEGGQLNRDFRGRVGATNVLSFPVEAGVWGERFFGDIAICAPRVAAEARAFGRPVRAHYAHLTIHGLLHLLGYDHERSPERRRMESIEIRLLGELGLPNPYRVTPRAALRSVS